LAATPSLLSRPIVVAGSKRSPRRTCDHGGLEPLDQLAADGAVHEDALARGAALSGAR
jgi:hypothetical protein